VDVLPARSDLRPALEAFLKARGSERVARRGVLVDALERPALSAWADGRLLGVATYVVEGTDCELLTLHATTSREGVGSALLAEVRATARSVGCRRLWVVTTNDNVDALRFYQRRGFRLTALRPGAVDVSRETLKPEIPRTGAHQIPLRDELALEMSLVD
jgi:GNAT superfamily N-acetyltransferase